MGWIPCSGDSSKKGKSKDKMKMKQRRPVDRMSSTSSGHILMYMLICFESDVIFCLNEFIYGICVKLLFEFVVDEFEIGDWVVLIVMVIQDIVG